MTQLKPRVHLTGMFRIEDANGLRIPFSSAKAQGLLALVITSPNGECSRKFLQEKLWSDSSSEQASGSLRQVLRMLRKTLQEAGLPFHVERRQVRMDLDQIEVIERKDWEFLEGLSVPDAEFDAWLTAQRRKRSTVAVAPSRLYRDDPDDAWRVAIRLQDRPTSTQRWCETLFADALSRSLREMFSAPVSLGPEIGRVSAGLLQVEMEGALAPNGAMTLRAAIDHPARNHHVWSGRKTIQEAQNIDLDNPDLSSLVNDLIEALGDYLILIGREDKVPSDPDRLCRLALRSLFSMRPDRVLDADAAFQRAYEAKPRGLYLAWRAQLRAIQSIERHHIDEVAVADEGRALCARALELEPQNSMVLATVSNALRRFDRNDDYSLALAHLSVQRNPANPMGWWAFSAANSYAGRDKDSVRAGLVARHLAALSPHRFWWDNQCMVPALLTGDLDRALDLAEQGHLGNPMFRPPLRYLVALYAHAGRPDDALAAMQKLRAFEPDFEVDRLLLDQNYPTSILRRVPNLDKGRILGLI